jgi:anti-sigma-K factor RskA
MDCNRTEELFEQYILGALDSTQRGAMESHLETCDSCTARLRSDSETVAALALAAPQLAVPAAVKQRLFMRVDADLARQRSAPGWYPRLSAAVGALRRSFVSARVPYAGTALVSALVLIVIFTGVWFNGRLNDVSQDAKDLSQRVEAGDARDEEMLREFRSHRYGLYEALRMSTSPGSTVNLLSGTDRSSKARGMMMVSSTGAEGLLLVVNLPPLPSDRVYQVWLVSKGRKYSSETFTVDSSGWGQAVVMPVIPFALVDTVEITVEPSGNSIAPTGSGVLKGVL